MVTISGTMSINLWMITAAPYRERGELALFMTPGTSESYAFVCCTSLLLGSLVHAFRKASPTWFFAVSIVSGLGLYFSTEELLSLMSPSMALAFWGYAFSLGARKPAGDRTAHEPAESPTP